MVLELSYVFFYILIGYWCLSRIHSKKLALFTRPNYVILYESAIWGGAIFVVASLVGMVVKSVAFECSFLEVVKFEACGKIENVPYPQMFEVIYAPVLAWILWYQRNASVDIREALEASAKESGLIPSLILEALKKKDLVEITTRRRKVYVGWILRGPGIASNGSMVDVAITPLSSGYRDRVDVSIVLTTDYEPVLNQKVDVDEGSASEQINEALDKIGLEMNVLVPLSEIVSIRPFNLETKVQFEKLREE